MYSTIVVFKFTENGITSVLTVWYKLTANGIVKDFTFYTAGWKMIGTKQKQISSS